MNRYQARRKGKALTARLGSIRRINPRAWLGGCALKAVGLDCWDCRF